MATTFNVRDAETAGADAATLADMLQEEGRHSAAGQVRAVVAHLQDAADELHALKNPPAPVPVAPPAPAKSKGGRPRKPVQPAGANGAPLTADPAASIPAIGAAGVVAAGPAPSASSGAEGEAQ